MVEAGKHRSRVYDEVCEEDPDYVECVQALNDPGPSFRSLTDYVQKQQTQSESGDKKDKHEGDPPQRKARTADEPFSRSASRVPSTA